MPRLQIRIDSSTERNSQLETIRPEERRVEATKHKTLKLAKNLFPLAVCAYLNSAGIVGGNAIYPLIALSVGGVVILRRNGRE